MRVLIANVDPLLRPRLAEVLHGGADVVEWFDGDPTDLAAVTEATARVDAVVCGLPGDAEKDPEGSLLAASCGVYNLLTASRSVTRFVLLSSLRHFEQYPVEFQVSEYWAPRPTVDVADLVPFTAEAVVREAAQVRAVRAVCLRLAEVVEDGAEPDSRAVHVDDVVRAVQRALVFTPDLGGPPHGEPSTGWWVFHVVGAGRTRFPQGLAAERAEYLNGGRGSALGYRPRHDVAQGAPVVDCARPAAVRVGARQPGPTPRVVLLGAGGPFGTAAGDALAGDHLLRMVRRSWPEHEDPQPQQPGAPVVHRWQAPHEQVSADVTRYDQVLAALQDQDAVVYLSVVRDDPVEAFRVNTVGAYLVAKAAVQSGVRRVVLTGPNQVFDPMCGGYWPDFDLGSDVPQRPGEHLYMLSKFLGQEIMRVFAVEHGLEVPNLVFGYFATEVDGLHRLGGHPFMIAWSDVGEAIAAAVRVPELPRPYEVFHVLADMPHGKYRNDRAVEVLGWHPRQSLPGLYRRDLTGD